MTDAWHSGRLTALGLASGCRLRARHAAEEPSVPRSGRPSGRLAFQDGESSESLMPARTVEYIAKVATTRRGGGGCSGADIAGCVVAVVVVVALVVGVIWWVKARASNREKEPPPVAAAAAPDDAAPPDAAEAVAGAQAPGSIPDATASVDALVQEAMAAKAEGALAGAEAKLREATAIDPDNVRARLVLAWTLVGLERRDEALDEFQVVAGSAPPGPQREEAQAAIDRMSESAP